jgi:2'-5' RNA ligase
VTALRRAFLAVVPSEDALRWTDAVVASARRDGDGLRWTRTEQRHLTLQFLGRVDDPDALLDSVSASVRRIAPFALDLGAAGTFPSARRASVLWVGVAHGGDELGALAAAVTEATAPLGFVADDRPYHPHLTLARSAQARDLRPLLDQLDAAPSAAWTVDEVVLFESDTRPDGAVHHEHARLALAAS